jgi:hypothetical protein
VKVQIQGKINSKRMNIDLKMFKTFFARTNCLVSIKLGTNHVWVKGIQVCANKGIGPLQRGDNYKSRVESSQEPLGNKVQIFNKVQMQGCKNYVH